MMHEMRAAARRHTARIRKVRSDMDEHICKQTHEILSSISEQFTEETDTLLGQILELTDQLAQVRILLDGMTKSSQRMELMSSAQESVASLFDQIDKLVTGIMNGKGVDASGTAPISTAIADVSIDYTFWNYNLYILFYLKCTVMYSFFGFSNLQIFIQVYLRALRASIMFI
jgi:predicted component of type VI protein secretion system